MYSLNLEDVDNFILADGGLSSNAVTHNCFVAGTEITLSNGDVKNIEDVDFIYASYILNYKNVDGGLKEHENQLRILRIFRI
jgi:hypothetical protein